MEGMDLWTSMFSSDFIEGEHSLNDQFGGMDNNMREAGDANENGEDGEDDGDDNEHGDAENNRSKMNKPEIDDDAIFDFELEPIVSIAEADHEPHTRSAHPTRIIQGHSLSMSAASTIHRPKELSRTLPVPMRPTTSQINATDENGLPINYELGVIYICPACGTEYRQQDMWKRHMNSVHQYNTRRGLNFVAIDKLYHRCLECNKHIAMHSRENLLKHKFTHLPFRCTKCYICKREYKYRQDLMVHLRMVHCDEVVAMMRNNHGPAGRKTRVRDARTEEQSTQNVYQQRMPDDGIEVKNELLEPDTEEANSYADDEQSRGSAAKKRRSIASEPAVNAPTDVLEDFINYMCPECGAECETKAQWNQHIEFLHDYVSRRGLNFRSVDMQMQCIECLQYVKPNTIKSLRAHKFSHLPHKEWMRCKLCYKGFVAHELIVKHLLEKHNMQTLIGEDEANVVQVVDDYEVNLSSNGNSNGNDNGNANDMDEEYDDDARWDDTPRRPGRHGSDDMFEPHIDYLCPQCGKTFIEKRQWRTHVVQVHDMNDLATLNFKSINERQLQCTECDKIITNAYGIQNAQQHRFTHLPYKAYARCRKCHKSYTDRKGLVKHLATYHHVGTQSITLSGSTGPTGSAPPEATLSKLKPKQIVTIANETYEITYLDDDGWQLENDDKDFGEQLQTDEDINSTITSTRNAGSQHRYKCVDCGSLFATQAALKSHISEEHDFMESQYSAKKFDNAEPAETSRAATETVDCGSSSTIEENYIFLCPACGEEYKTQYEWRRHINAAHHFDNRQSLNMRQLDKYRYQCTHCNDIVCNSKLKGLQDHHFRHLPYRLYLKCLICGICYNHKPNIAAHLRTRHNIIDFGEPTTPKDMSEANESATSSEPPAVSVGRTLKPQAGGMPARPAGLNTLEDSISYHNAVDLDFITYFCPQCNKNFDSHAFWRKHIVEKHNYNSREGLNFRQIDNHHFLCLECYKRVTVTHTKGAIGQLQSHKFRHLPYRSFKCLTCNGEFVRKQMFFKHLNRETNLCDNKPVTNSSNNDTAEVAEGRKQQTPTSEATSSVAGDCDELNLDDYRLLCPQCGEAFCSKSVWREHINIEHDLGKRQSLRISRMGEGVYQCVDCDEVMMTNKVRVLQLHCFKHLPYSAYIRCQLCAASDDDITDSFDFPNMLDLRKHIRDRHPAVVSNENDTQMQAEEFEVDEDEGENSLPANEAASNSNGPYMPLPPHLLDDVDDVEFDEQYLLG